MGTPSSHSILAYADVESQNDQIESGSVRVVFRRSSLVGAQASLARRPELGSRYWCRTVESSWIAYSRRLAIQP